VNPTFFLKPNLESIASILNLSSSRLFSINSACFKTSGSTKNVSTTVPSKRQQITHLRQLCGFVEKEQAVAQAEELAVVQVFQKPVC
jgi:hypothetical protein